MKRLDAIAAALLATAFSLPVLLPQAVNARERGRWGAWLSQRPYAIKGDPDNAEQFQLKLIKQLPAGTQLSTGYGTFFQLKGEGVMYQSLTLVMDWSTIFNNPRYTETRKELATPAVWVADCSANVQYSYNKWGKAWFDLDVPFSEGWMMCYEAGLKELGEE